MVSAGKTNIFIVEDHPCMREILRQYLEMEGDFTVSGVAETAKINQATRIAFVLPESSDISLDVFDVMGRHVMNLARGFHLAGSHSVEFDAAHLSSGLYTYRLTAGSHRLSRTMLRVK